MDKQMLDRMLYETIDENLKIIHSDMNNLRIEIKGLRIELNELKKKYHSHINDCDSAHKI